MSLGKRAVIAVSVSATLAVAGIAHALTNEEIRAQIQALYQELAALQAQIQQYAPSVNVSPTAPAVPSSVSCLRISSNLYPGSHDESPGGPVSALQVFLRGAGDFTYPEITGYFGPSTLSALKRYQERAGIVSWGTPETTGYGVAGPRTRQYIETASCSVSNPAVLPVALPSSDCIVNGLTVNNRASMQLFSTTNAPAGQLCSALSATRTCTNGTLSGDASYKYASCTNMLLHSCTVSGITMASGETRTLFNRASVSSGDTCALHSQSRTCTDGTLSGSTSFGFFSCEGPRSCTLDGATVADGKSENFYYVQHIPAGELCSAYSLSRSCSNGTLGGDSSYKYASCAPISASACTADNIVLESGSSTMFYTSLAAPAGATCASISQVRACAGGSLSGSSSYNRASCSDSAPCTLDGVTLSHATTSIFYSARTAAFGTTCSSISQARTCTNASLSGSASFKYASCTVAPPSSCTLDGTTLATGASGTFYKAPTVAYGSSCSSITRTCSQGVLSGDATYQYANCTVSDPPASQKTPCNTGSNYSEQAGGGSTCI